MFFDFKGRIINFNFFKSKNEKTNIVYFSYGFYRIVFL
jgi:hypothetical protein